MFRNYYGVAALLSVVVLTYLVGFAAGPAATPSGDADGQMLSSEPLTPDAGHVINVELGFGGTSASVYAALVGKRQASDDPSVKLAERHFLYLPIFLLAKKDGKIEVSQTASGTSTQVQLHLVLNQPQVKSIILKYLIDQGLLISATTSESQLNPLALDAYQIETAPNYEPHIAFAEATKPTSDRYDAYPIARANPVDADKFVHDLQSGNAPLIARVAFSGFGFLGNYATISSEDISNSELFRKLDGKNGQAKATLVTRQQVSKILSEACDKKDIVIVTDYDDPDFDKLLEAATTSLTEQALTLTDQAGLDKYFQENSWDSNDLKADLVKVVEKHANASGDHESSWAKHVSSNLKGGFKSGGSFGIPELFNASGNMDANGDKESVEDVRNDLKDKFGIETDAKYDNGTIQIIPKQMDVFRNDLERLTATQTYNVGKKKTFAKESSATISIGPTNFLTYSSTDSVEQLRDKANSYDLDVKAMTEKLNETSRVLAELKSQVAALETSNVRVVTSPAALGVQVKENPAHDEDVTIQPIKPGEGKIVGAWVTPTHGLHDFGKCEQLYVTVVDATHVKVHFMSTLPAYLGAKVYTVGVPGDKP